MLGRTSHVPQTGLVRAAQSKRHPDRALAGVTTLTQKHPDQASGDVSGAGKATGRADDAAPGGPTSRSTTVTESRKTAADVRRRPTGCESEQETMPAGRVSRATVSSGIC